MKKALPYLVAVVVAAITFSVGMQYGQNKGFSGSSRLGGRNGFGQDAGQGARPNGSGMMGKMGRGQGNFIGGEVLSKDDKSVTIKLPNGGSQIVFYSASTHLVKAEETTWDQLKEGMNVMVNGSSNADGTVTAQNIQIRPVDKSLPAPAASTSPTDGASAPATPSVSVPTAATAQGSSGITASPENPSSANQ